MTDKERQEAMEWLDRHIAHPAFAGPYARTLKAMLAEPRLPEEPSDASLIAIEAILEKAMPLDPDVRYHEPRARACYRALYAHLTKPATKTVQVWRVEFSRNWNPEIKNFRSERDAHAFVEALEREPKGPTFSCIRVTGPHEQEVPA